MRAIAHFFFIQGLADLCSPLVEVIIGPQTIALMVG